MKGAAYVAVLACLALAVQASAQNSIDGVWNVRFAPGPGVVINNLITLVDAAPGVGLFRVTGGSNDIGVAIARPDVAGTWDMYGTTLNLTIVNNGTTGALYPWDSTAPEIGRATRVAPPSLPARGYPNLAGAWINAAVGWVMTCIQSKTDWSAYICVRSALARNGTVVSEQASAFQDDATPYTIDVNTNTGNQTWTVTPDNNTITITNATSRAFILNMTRQVLPTLPPTAPSMAGLFRSDPSTQVMGCAVPTGAPAAALCMGAGLAPGGFTYVFSVVERQKANGLFTDQITSVGAFSSRWSDEGNFKRQYLFGQATNGTLLAVGYRTDIVQTLIGSWEFSNVTATCAGGSEEAITCVGSGVTNNTVSSFSMAARGLGLGQYDATYLYQLGNASAYFKGVMRVSPDGGSVSYNTSAIRYTGITPGSVGTFL